MLRAATENTRGRATKAQQRRRVMAIYKMLEQGESRAYVLDYAAASWGISTRQADTYRAAACEMLSARIEKDQEYHLAQAIERLTNLFRVAFEVSDYRNAIKAQQELNRLFGLYAA